MRGSTALPVLLATVLLGRPVLAQTAAAKQTPSPVRTPSGTPVRAPAQPAGPRDAAHGGLAPVRFRVVLNGCYTASGPTYSETRTISEYAETTTLHASYDAGGGFAPDAAVQVTVFRGLGALVGYSSVSRDVTGSLDVSRPHPLYLNRPRTGSASLEGYGSKETALHLDLAYAGGKGHLDWSVFAGYTRFQVSADLLGVPSYTEVYPYDDLAISGTPSASEEGTAHGLNAGGRLDYRIGASGRFGAGVQLMYSRASVELKASTASSPASHDAGGLSVGVGLRVYF
jgi:hypothetical protein